MTYHNTIRTNPCRVVAVLHAISLNATGFHFCLVSLGRRTVTFCVSCQRVIRSIHLRFSVFNNDLLFGRLMAQEQRAGGAIRYTLYRFPVFSTSLSNLVDCAPACLHGNTMFMNCL